MFIFSPLRKPKINAVKIKVAQSYWASRLGGCGYKAEDPGVHSHMCTVVCEGNKEEGFHRVVKKE